MVWPTLCKLLQKQTYDVLSHRYGTYLLTGGFILVIVSGFQFGEVVLEWSQEKYAAVFNSFSDNVAGRSYQTRLCLPVPIDVVYTWVNGSDPKLLADLRRFKASLELELNETRAPQCPFDNCVRSSVLIADTGEAALQDVYAAIVARASKVKEIAAPGEGSKNVTALFFPNVDEADDILKDIEALGNKNTSFHVAYYTSDWTLANAVLLTDTLLMTGFPHTLTSEQLLHKLPESFNQAVDKLEIEEDAGVAVMHVPKSAEAEELLHHTNVSIDGKEPTVSSASLIWDMHDVRYNEEISASRFADNEELRYSLRSIETFAPWVRHVYLVTNGQIPSWLNLDNPRLTVVTHADIFVNRSHLPAFSSPSIEAHLHRIPGLSNKFIYLNDDVMFGKDVWPDDFYTHAHGQKMYLTWPVPNCQDGCPSSWIRDGYCDKACNNSECEWDGGDCAGGAPNTLGEHGGGGGGLGSWHVSSDSAAYCSSGCANNWLADRYCDQACNTKECGYDAGDCGVANFDKLYSIALNPNIHQYVAQKGMAVMYVNISALFPEGTVLEEGEYDEDPVVRTATLAQKYHTMSILLYSEKNASTVAFTIKGKYNDTDIKFAFNVSVDPNQEEKVEELVTAEAQAGADKSNISSQNNTEGAAVPTFVFEDVPTELQQPRLTVGRVSMEGAEDVPSLSDYVVDEETRELWGLLLQDLENGEITQKGFNVRKRILWHEYVMKTEKLGKKPQAVDKDRPLFSKAELSQLDPEQERGGVQKDGEQEPELAANGDDKTFDSYLQSKQQHLPKRGIDSVPNPNPNTQNIDLGNGVDGKGGGNENMDGPLKQEAANVEQMSQGGVKLNKDGEKYEKNEHIMREGEQQKTKEHQGEKGINNVAQMLDGLKSVNERLAKNHKLKREGERREEDRRGRQRVHEQKVNDNVLVEEKQPNEERRGGVDGGQRQKILNANEGGNVEGTPQYRAGSYKSRKLNDIDSSYIINGREGFLPWEKQHVFSALQKRELERKAREQYDVGHPPSRRLLDTFGDSLRHVNRLFNNAYGYSARKVPAHMPHFMDRSIMYELQAKFPEEWDATSSHRIRSSTDMQFAFSYMYFIMSEPQPTTVGDIFDELDNDRSGVLSDRELRTMATRLYELPLDLQSLTSMEQILINCSQHLPSLVTFTWGRNTEAYYDKNMPQVTKVLLNNCGPVIDLIQKSFKGRTKYKFETLDDEEIAFKMIHTNVSQVVGQLDDIRRHPKKFICLNDNIDHSKEEAKTVKAVLLDFYESILPTPSSFELAREYRNRFLHTDELREWRKYRDWLKLWTQIALGLLILFTIGSFFADKILALRRRFYRHRQPSHDSTQDSPSSSSSSKSTSVDDMGEGEEQAEGRPPDIVEV